MSEKANIETYLALVMGANGGAKNGKRRAKDEACGWNRRYFFGGDTRLHKNVPRDVFSQLDCGRKKVKHDVVLYKMPESRPCDYCFSLLDGSVFVDFEIKDALSYLVRISFDGYGCYCIQGASNPLCRKNTELLEKLSEAE